MENSEVYPFPHFIIIGMAKCGTTTLSDVLRLHPDIHFSTPKEPRFFNQDKLYAHGFSAYKNAFGEEQEYAGKKVGEGSVNYSHAPEIQKSCERISRHLPKVKIIFMVRDPIKKIISSWSYRRVTFGRIDEKDINKSIYTNPSFIKNVSYNEILNTLNSYFNEEQILVLFLEDLKTCHVKTIRKVCEFIGVDPDKSPSVEVHSNIGVEYIKPRPLMKPLRKIPGIRKLYNSLPNSIREQVNTFTHRKYLGKNIPVLSEETRKYILEEIREDNLSFLSRQGKPSDFWNLS